MCSVSMWAYTNIRWFTKNPTVSHEDCAHLAVLNWWNNKRICGSAPSIINRTSTTNRINLSECSLNATSGIFIMLFVSTFNFIICMKIIEGNIRYCKSEISCRTSKYQCFYGINLSNTWHGHDKRKSIIPTSEIFFHLKMDGSNGI